MAKETFSLRRGEPGQVIDYTDAEGNARQMRATDDGVFLPGSTVEEAILDGFDLPHARVKKADRPKRPTSRKVTPKTPTVQLPDAPATEG